MANKKKNVRKSNINFIKENINEVQMTVENGVFIFSGEVSINDFANSTKIAASKIITYFFKQGKMLNINQLLTEEQIAELCLEFELDFKKEKEVTSRNVMDELEIEEDEKDLEKRPAIITIMGHVDHGKTTLIDTMRNSQIASGEAGGITQHTGAYQVVHEKTKITFLDTPGHASFSSMRARGAHLTDIVVLVVAADDGVMVQTKEAIDHAKSANVPIIVFVNKMDKKDSDIERIKSELATAGVTCEEWGGDVQFVYGSALKKQGIKELFDAINILADVLELKANPNRFAIGTIVEARIDKGMGSVATLIVQNGSLHKGDYVVAGNKYGKIRTMVDSWKKPIKIAPPGTPVIISGLVNVPHAGDKFYAFHDEKFAKNLAETKAHEDKQKEITMTQQIQIDDGLNSINVIVKADVQGTTEAIAQSIENIKNEELKIKVIRSAIGDISQTDCLLAQASNAIIVGFHVSAPSDVKAFIKQEKLDVRIYKIIYKIIEDLESLAHGKLKPKYELKKTGEAQILKVIPASKIGNIAGSKVISGFIKSKSIVKLLRNGKEIIQSNLDSLQHGPNAVKKVDNGFEFGCHIKKFNDIKEGDIIEAYEEIQVKRGK